VAIRGTATYPITYITTANATTTRLPAVGRSKIPAKPRDYAFVGDNPIGNTDPSGECWADRFGTWGPDCANEPLISAKGGAKEVIVKCFKYFANFPETEHPGWRVKCVPKREGLRGCLHRVFAAPTDEALGELAATALHFLVGAVAAEVECYKGAREIAHR
jgi:hypothetical protein